MSNSRQMRTFGEPLKKEKSDINEITKKTESLDTHISLKMNKPGSNSNSFMSKLSSMIPFSSYVDPQDVEDIMPHQRLKQ